MVSRIGNHQFFLTRYDPLAERVRQGGLSPLIPRGGQSDLALEELAFVVDERHECHWHPEHLCRQPRHHIDRRRYAVGRRITTAQMATINVLPQRFHGEWKYVIRPRHV